MTSIESSLFAISPVWASEISLVTQLKETILKQSKYTSPVIIDVTKFTHDMPGGLIALAVAIRELEAEGFRLEMAIPVYLAKENLNKNV